MWLCLPFFYLIFCLSWKLISDRFFRHRTRSCIWLILLHQFWKMFVKLISMIIRSYPNSSTLSLVNVHRCIPINVASFIVADKLSFGRHTAAIFLDIQQAFDRVWPNGIIPGFLISRTYFTALVRLVLGKISPWFCRSPLTFHMVQPFLVITFSIFIVHL